MGLWHGANWTFALWGLWHATLIYLYRVSEPVRVRMPSAVREIAGWATTLAVCMLGWIFFRAATVADSLQMLATAFNPWRLGIRSLRENTYLVTAIYLAGMLVAYGVTYFVRWDAWPRWARIGGLATVNAVMAFGVFLLLRRVEQFIYFQF
jgi:hypothetical protein